MDLAGHSEKSTLLISMDGQQPRWRKRFLTAILLGMGLGPFFAALLGTADIPRPRRLASTKQLPGLAFRQYAVNLREIPPQGRVSVPFHFWNRGSTAVEIKRIEPSCGCLAPRLTDQRTSYAPGAQGSFEVQVEPTKEEPGPHAFTVTVIYDDGAPREEVLSFRLTIPEQKVTVTPSELFIYQMNGQTETTELAVIDRRGKPIEIISARSSSPHLKLAVGTTEHLDAKTTRIPIQVQAGAGLPAGPETAIISIRLNDDDVGEITIPVFLHGRPDPVQLTSGVRPRSNPPESSQTRSAMREDQQSGDRSESSTHREEP
jgi:hypothetical protein